MGKRVIFAVAGSGKTTYIISQLSLDKRTLIITYTDNNLSNLKNKILQKFGYFPGNIRLLSYFTFLHSFCYKPFLADILKTKGLIFDFPQRFLGQQTDRKYYVKNNRIYSNRISKLLEISGVLGDVSERLCKYFDDVYIDEIQDFGGHDFNFLKHIAKCDLDILFVGDFYQHTYDTSRDGNVNKSLHNDYVKYKKEFKKMGLTVDTTTLSKSYRCSPTICQFIREKIGIDIYSHRDDETLLDLIKPVSDTDKIYKDNDVVKLFYQEHYKFGCYSRNWAESKGEDKYENVVVVLNAGTYKFFDSDKLHELTPQTRNKLYVACSRARNNLFFVPETSLKKYKK